MCVAALARNFNDLSNTQFYVVFPCFLLSGVLSPLDVLPEWAQALAWLLPRTPVVDLARAELLGVAAAPRAPWLLAAWTGLSVLIASRAMIRRLVK
jgi:ABC-type polysaccharide/polyol phosphate export permease